MIVHETATDEVIEELHAALLSIDPSYDRKYTAAKDLKKMPVLHKLLTDKMHIADFTYLFEAYSCGEEGCPYGCEPWPEAAAGSAEAAFQAELKKRTRLPRKKDEDHFMSWEETCHLADNDERDLPSASGMPRNLLAAKKKCATCSRSHDRWVLAATVPCRMPTHGLIPVRAGWTKSSSRSLSTARSAMQLSAMSAAGRG